MGIEPTKLVDHCPTTRSLGIGRLGLGPVPPRVPVSFLIFVPTYQTSDLSLS